ncbi:MAG: hypothetical protein KDE33_16750 [Bacteroidetes bacterium]|nr:hypothetical protein [Bacteroidota bacterium]MCB9227672.1 hypothetical protein [Chitinophagales bacterium]
MKNLLLIINIFFCSLLLAQTNTNSNQNTHRNYGYFGLEIGNSYLTSKYKYQPNSTELLNNKSIRNKMHINVRFFGGYCIKNKHRLELSIQNLNIKTGFGFTNYDEVTSSKIVTKGATFFNMGYLYKPFNYKRFNFDFGPHFGIAIAGNSDFAGYESYSVSSSNGDFYSVEATEVKLHQVFINFGARVNLRLELGKKRKSELFFNTSFYYTPYNVRAYDFNYQINNKPRVYARSSTGVMNWSFSLGYSYKIFGKWADTSKNGYYID